MSKRDAKKEKQTEKGGLFLEHIKITSFGRYSNKIIGPLTPGLNVVFGENEAGKTTTNELIKGVMFGWPSARGNQSNPYKPEAADRAGSLFFKDGATDEVVELKRIKNTDAAGFDSEVLAGIDQETFQTMFALTSDELLGLDRHAEVTARLLTAGSGTASSPAYALQVVQDEIKQIESRSSQFPESVPNLRQRQAALLEEVNHGRSAASALLAKERSLAALGPRRETLAAQQRTLNAQIEKLRSVQSRLQALDEQRAANEAELDRARLAQASSERDATALPADEVAAVSRLDTQAQAQLQDALDDLDEKRIRLEHAADVARGNLASSRADYDLAMEDDCLQAKSATDATKRTAQRVLSVVVSVALLAIGAYALFLAQANGRLSYLVMGALSVLFALLIGVVGVAMSIRPTKVEEQLDEERSKLAWVVKQDEKALRIAETDVSDHQQRIQVYLDANGLGAAAGSIRRARRLIDQAREDDQARAAAQQNAKALEMQAAALRSAIDDATRQRAAALEEVGLAPASTADGIAAAITHKSEERESIAALALETDREYGELSQELVLSKSSVDFARAKQDLELVETQLKETSRRLATLVIARRSLESAIAEWERKSQPEVYRTASRLFAAMTGGAWEAVRMNAQGEIEVVDAVKTVRPPHLLSLGTRQQLYLSLRIALLMTAKNVGRNVPVLCDDILVNFDERRRDAAAAALAELARHRQVILFTCHRDVAALIQRVDPASKLLEL